MDTRSKNYKYSYLVKVTAMVLLFSLVFSAGYSAFWLFRSKVIFADEGKESLVSTPSFLYNISNDIRTIAQYSAFSTEMVDNEDLFAKKDDTTRISIKNLNSDRELALDLFDIIQEFKKLNPSEDTETQHETNSAQNDVVSDVSGTYLETNRAQNNATTSAYIDGENYSSGELSANQENWGTVFYGDYDAQMYEATTNIDLSVARKLLSREYKSYDAWNSNYQILRNYIFQIVSNAVSHDTINTEFNEKIADIKNYNWMQYCNRYYVYQNLVSAMVNIRFVVVNKRTNAVITNIANQDFHLDAFKANIDDSLFHISYSAEKGLLNGGIPENSEATGTIVDLFGYTFGAPTSETFNNSYLENYFGDGYDAYIMLPNDLQRGDVYHYIYQNYQDINNRKTLSLPTIVLLILLSAVPVVYLALVAGRKMDNSLKLAATDRIPFLFHLLLSLGLTAGLITLIGILVSFEFNNVFYDTSLYIILSAVYSAVPAAVGILFALAALVELELLLSFVRLLKAGQFYRNTLLRYLFNGVKRLIHILLFPFTTTIKKRIIFGIIGFIVVNGLLAMLLQSLLGAGEGDVAFFLFVLLFAFDAAALSTAIRYAKGIHAISGAAAEMKAGNYDVNLDSNVMPKSLRKTALDLLTIRDSIQLAVNERLKGERMKTELITNVSHDLKTPLTSIINYVDLLKKCGSDDEEAGKYLEVLDEKSKRLKHLIEDLTEASKASTGNIRINSVPIDLCELAVQALGEHDDLLKENGLEAVFTTENTHPIIFADSQHTWRIIDNLFSNVRKYAQTGTRVYIDVYTENGYGVFSMKNISRTPLNMPVSELTERFVRGDASRTGDGSGLGLSIAQSLCELQHGRFVIAIDGDLFKASVKLPLYEEKPASL